MKNKKANTETIFKHLCDQMEKLDKGDIGVNEAKAQSNLARQATNVLNYEINRANAMAKHGEHLRSIEEN